MMRTFPRLAWTLMAGTALSGSLAQAGELPTGASLAYGAASVSIPSANQMTIQQSSQTAILNWQGFSIGQGARVDISQPSASSALLNRVTGSAPSTIAGQLNANGQVYLVNPNGIAITTTGVVRTGAFVASTLDTSDEDFKAGRRVFRGNGHSAGVSNHGSIEIGAGGFAALLGGRVENAGVISVPTGRVGLGAGEQATLDLSGDGFLQVAVPSAPDGSDAALIRHSGQIRAAGGRVEIQAATARDAARNAINLSGIVEARSVGGRSGAIVLGGGAGGTVAVSGRLDASTRPRAAKAGRGGDIAVTGDNIRLAGARIDAGGTAGGGRVRIGGDYQGGGSLQRARTTRVDAATTIRADAGSTGDGGSVVVWSDQMTEFAGRITARGGTQGGDGGSAEVSGRALLAYTGETDLSAAQGRFGSLLLDPYNVFITNGPGSGATQAGGTFTAGANDSVINAATLSGALNTANVTVTTGGAGSPGTQAGDIAVQANLAWTAPTTLSLSAFRNITIGESAVSPNTVTVAVPTGGGLSLRADNSGTGVGTVTFFNSGSGGGSVTAAAGSNVAIFYNPASNPAGSGVNPTSYTAPTNYAVAAGNGGVSGGGTLIASMLVNTPADLQNMRNNLAGAYALGRGIDAAGLGFAPVGSTDTPFTGRFDGLGQTVTNLTINAPGAGSAGLFGAATGAVVANVALAALNVTGGNNTGGLIGFATGTTVSGASVAGRVAGANTTGGLAGALVNGSIAGSSSAATVSGTDNVGGLVGVTDGGTIALSFATGGVSGGSQVGGLVGIAQSTGISRSYATGGVTGTDLVGGLVGGVGGEGTSLAVGTISESFANGAVTSQARGGGLVGLLSNGGQITNSYATGLTSGGTAAGGLVGEINSVPAASNAQAVVTNTYATGLITGAGTRGGLIGGIVGALQTVATSYWDTQTTGVATSAGPGATGLTTAQLQGTLPAGFAAPTWATQPSAYPYLAWRYPTGILAISGSTLAAADPGAPIAGEPVRVAAGGALSYQTNSGANGYYYVARDPLTGAAPQGVTAYLDGANRGSGTRDAPTGAGAVTNLDARIGRIVVSTAQPTTSGLATVLATAGDSALSPNIPYTVTGPGAVPTFGLGLPTFVTSLSPTGFTVDRSIVSAGTLQIAGAATAPAGPVTIAPGQIVQSQAGDVVITTTQFVNNAGAAAVQAGGRFLIYSQDYAADQRGGLVAGNLYNRTFAGSPPGTVTQAGSQFIYSRQPILTFGVAGAAREYGSAVLTATPTTAGLVNGDTPAQAFTGQSTITDTTSLATGVGAYPGAVQVSQGSLVSTIGYGFAFANGALTITPAPLTVTAGSATKVYGDTLVLPGTAFTATGLRNADQVTSVTLTSGGTPAAASVGGSPYAIVPSNAQGTGLVSGTGASNYAVTYLPGTLTVTPAPLTIRANDATKTFGTTLAFVGTEFTASGLRNADQVTNVTLTSAGAPAAATVAGSPYAIVPSNAQGTGLADATGVSNYAIAYTPGALSVGAAPTVPTPPVVPVVPGQPTPPPVPIDALTLALLEPTLSRQMQQSFIPVYDSPDDIVLAALGQEYPTLGLGRGGLPGPRDAVDEFEREAAELDAAMAACEEKDKRRVKQYTSCVGDALDAYAAKLELRRDQLPPALRSIPAAIRQAARRVRAAPTVAAARTAVRVVIATVRKAIALIRADEPTTARLQVRQGNAIASALQSVDNRLSRAVGL